MDPMGQGQKKGHQLSKPLSPLPYFLMSLSLIQIFFFYFVFEYNQRLFSLGGLTGNDRRFEHSICARRGLAASKRH